LSYVCKICTFWYLY